MACGGRAHLDAAAGGRPMTTPANGPKNAPQPRNANAAPITPPSRKASPVLHALRGLSMYAAPVAVVVCLLVTCSPATAQTIAPRHTAGYPAILSKSKASPHRVKVDFLRPKFAQPLKLDTPRMQWPAAPQRPQSVYDGWTRLNTTPLWGNRPGGSLLPRVTPVTLSDSQSEWADSHQSKGGHHG